MHIYLIDIDNTLVNFQPTGELYKRIFISKNKGLQYFILGYLMIFLTKYLWFIPGIISFQRKLILSLFSKVNQQILNQESDIIVKKVIKNYKQNFNLFLNSLLVKNYKIYLLTHAPSILAKKINKELNFHGHFSLKIKNYFSKDFFSLKNFNKKKILQKIKNNNTNNKIIYFADDLIDIKSLIFADEGYLVNSSKFTKLIVKIFFKRLKIWN